MTKQMHLVSKDAMKLEFGGSRPKSTNVTHEPNFFPADSLDYVYSKEKASGSGSGNSSSSDGGSSGSCSTSNSSSTGSSISGNSSEAESHSIREDR